ncbi:MAG: ATP-binding protein [Candidatus Orphnella occulta]|nr:ATP-binding protein [Candidatus Orphnella occulta]
MILIYFFYGLAFFILGFSIFVYPKKESAIKLADNLLLIACFGIIHGINEWVDMFTLIKGPSEMILLRVIGLLLLGASFVFLIQFGVTVICADKRKYAAIKLLPILLYIGWLVLILSSSQRLLHGNIWARYLLGVPGILLTAYALFLEATKFKNTNMPVSARNLRLAGAAFLFYALLSGLIVPKADFFPSSFFNYEAFLDITGIPVQVFRSACAVLIAYIMIRVLNIFDLETEAKIKNLLKKTQTAEKKYRTLTDASPDCIKLFDVKGNLVYINQGGLDEHKLKNIEEARAWSYLNGIVEQDRDNFRDTFKQATLGKTNTIEIRHTEDDSTSDTCLETMAPFKNSDGNVIGVFGVSRDISNIKKLEHVKDSLIQMIVHDLLNPLAIVFQGMQILENNLKDNLSEQSKYIFKSSSQQLMTAQNMISNLLDIGKMEEGELKLKYEMIDIEVLANETINSMKILSKDKEIYINIAPGIPRLSADKDILKRVIFNLIGNALKFTPSGSNVKVSIDSDKDDYVIIGVKDQGEGVPDQYKEKIFDKFVQVQHNETRYMGGAKDWALLSAKWQ